MRRPLIAGNWKMYKTCQETRSFFQEFRPLVDKTGHCDIVVCPSFVSLHTAVEAAGETRIEIGGQNLYWAQEGAYTGEVCGEMLRAVGCRWVIVAHSERRQHFGETDETAHKRIIAALESGLKPIVCVGEALREREEGRTHAVLHRQFFGGISALTPEQFGGIVIAYEPVWAIGTGRTATPDLAADAHRVIRGFVQERYGDNAAASCRILYGGSVKPDNIKNLMAEEGIDGALVGGASLNPASFASIVNY